VVNTPTHRVAIVGSGPGGFYTAEHLLRSGLAVAIDFYDRLPTPFGLVRGGVAPDHPKIKTVAAVFDKILRDPRVRFVGNVQVGDQLTVSELQVNYGAVVLATGAGHSSRLSIPGSGLQGAYGATDFVGWYNGVPDFKDCTFDLSGEAVVVVGHGNVAADLCRILLTPIDLLAKTDIARHALDQLAASRVRRVHLVGRRGPVQAKFSNAELRELALIPDCAVHVSIDQLELDASSQAELDASTSGMERRNLDLFKSIALGEAPGKPKTLSIHFLRSPLHLIGDTRIKCVRLAHNRLTGAPFEQRALSTGEEETLSCGLYFESIGFHGTALSEVPFDEKRGVIPNAGGRVLDGDSIIPGLYVTGWIKRGATGIIGSNRADGQETAHFILQDLINEPRLSQPGGHHSVSQILTEAKVTPTSFEDWILIDALEKSRGENLGRPREKIVDVAQMLSEIRQRGDSEGKAEISHQSRPALRNDDS
jgi:ferredoxin/flavodoxin---NADP+ reductase